MFSKKPNKEDSTSRVCDGIGPRQLTRSSPRLVGPHQQTANISASAPLPRQCQGEVVSPRASVARLPLQRLGCSSALAGLFGLFCLQEMSPVLQPVVPYLLVQVTWPTWPAAPTSYSRGVLCPSLELQLLSIVAGIEFSCICKGSVAAHGCKPGRVCFGTTRLVSKGGSWPSSRCKSAACGGQHHAWGASRGAEQTRSGGVCFQEPGSTTGEEGMPAGVVRAGALRWQKGARQAGRFT